MAHHDILEMEDEESSEGPSTFAPRYGLDLHSFDEEYVRDLTDGKPKPSGTLPPTSEISSSSSCARDGCLLT